MAPVTFYYSTQGFPQVLWTWGGVLKIWWGGLSQNMGETCEELKMLSKTACEGIHLILKLLAISLQASKFAKNELLHTYFSGILARFEVIIYCTFSSGLFLSGGRCPMGGIGFRGGFSKKNCLKKTLPQLFSSISFWSNAFLFTIISCKKKLCDKHNT